MAVRGQPHANGRSERSIVYGCFQQLASMAGASRPGGALFIKCIRRVLHLFCGFTASHATRAACRWMQRESADPGCLPGVARQCTAAVFTVWKQCRQGAYRKAVGAADRLLKLGNIDPTYRRSSPRLPRVRAAARSPARSLAAVAARHSAATTSRSRRMAAQAARELITEPTFGPSLPDRRFSSRRGSPNG